MEFLVKSTAIGKQQTPCVVVGIHETRRLTPAAQQLDKVSRGYLTTILKRGDIKGKSGETLMLHNVPWTQCERVLLVGCGKKKELDAAAFGKIVAQAATALDKAGVKEAYCYLPELAPDGHDLPWAVRRTVETAADALYRFNQLKTRDKQNARLRRMIFDLDDPDQQRDARRAIREGKAIAKGRALAKDLANLPGNHCTPTHLAEQAKGLAEHHPALTVKVLDEKKMEALNMGALLAVARGSRQPARLIVLEYQGGGKGDKPCVLVGKGITFDSGGISIKPSPAMDEMKYDMCGAASVLGALCAVAEMRLPLNVVGIIPSCENLPDGNAVKPGDIVTSMSGQTIEILNTDAEGRLILCDALTYSEQFDPDTVIDIATLTGACVIALGKHYSGLLGNDEQLIGDILAAGEASGDVAWQLPLGKDYQQQLKSNFADMANIGGREGGTITAACFLSRFTEKLTWAHLDIAGTAWLGGHKKGATGRPVPLLVQYLIDRCNKQERQE